MKISLRGINRLMQLLLALALAMVATPRAGGQINYSIDQTVWMMLYGVSPAQMNSAVWMASDSDGDGISNAAEMTAGTNPFDARSSFAVNSISQGANGLVFTFPTQAGKLYTLQLTTTLSNSSSWMDLSPEVQLEGTGGPMTLVGPSAPTTGTGSAFFRVTVQDMDSDGDGVSDWAEIVTGFNPNNSETNGTTNDQTAILADLAAENVVTVTATKATATQPASGAATDMGTITITRGGVLLFSTITVPLNWGGTAIPGVNYASLPSSVTIPARTNSVTLTVTPMANANRLTGATVTVNAMAGGGYTVGAAQSASVVINPAAAANGTGLTGMYYNSNLRTITPYQPSLLYSGTATLTRLDPTINFNWNSGSPGPG